MSPAMLVEISGDARPFMPGRSGDVGRGVVECERDWSSKSNDGSRGVIGRGMPGMYPGRRGVGDVVPAEPLDGTGEAGWTSVSEI